MAMPRAGRRRRVSRVAIASPECGGVFRRWTTNQKGGSRKRPQEPDQTQANAQRASDGDRRQLHVLASRSGRDGSYP